MKKEWEMKTEEYKIGQEMQQLPKEYGGLKPEYGKLPPEYVKLPDEYAGGTQTKEEKKQSVSNKKRRLRKMVYLVAATVSVIVMSQTLEQMPMRSEVLNDGGIANVDIEDINGSDLEWPDEEEFHPEGAVVTPIPMEEGTGNLSGRVCRALDENMPVEDAVLFIYQRDSVYKSIKMGDTGVYMVNLPAGEYRLEVTAPGYLTFRAYANVVEKDTTYMETFLMVEDSGNASGIAEGEIYDAISGSGLGGVSLEIRKGWNNTDYGEAVKKAETSADGAYFLQLPPGNYTMYAKKEGYIAASVNLVVQEDVTTLRNGTLSPVLSEDFYRIVLTWIEEPRDLDSHVEGKLSDESAFHVFYEIPFQEDGEQMVCYLDVDDMDGYGPETITLNARSKHPYYYYVYRYAGFGSVVSSQAQVQIYQGEHLVQTFHVPTSQGDGDYWNVFAIVDGELVVANTITSNADVGYVAEGNEGEVSFGQ